VTALVESLNAGVPMVALVGDAHRSHAHRNMTQESRQIDILRPAVKDVLRIEDGLRIPEFVRRAYAVATSGRPGPVVVALPEDIAHAEFHFPDESLWVDPATLLAPARRTRPAADEVERAAVLLGAAERPLILAGGGIHLSRAYDELLRLSERHDIPVAHTLSGKGALPCVHPLSVGLFGRYSRIANDLIAESDCLLVVGCKLGEVATKRYALPLASTPLVHLDVLAEEIGRWTRADVGLWGDAAAGLADLDSALDSVQEPSRAPYLADATGRMAAWTEATRPRYLSDAAPIEMPRLIGELNRAIPEAGVLVADGGFASHWAGLLYDTKASGRKFVADRGFASIGYGLPGSLGADLAPGDGPVVGLTGDGGLAMTLGGLETARRAGATFTLVVVNNAASGYVKALQHAVYGEGSYQSSDLLELNFAAVAESLGCQGLRVEDPADLAPALADAIANRERPSVVDVVVTRDPGEMLPGVDSRAQRPVAPGDRPA
jgi:acetolactate synthase-1/2/3 large subunit